MGVCEGTLCRLKQQDKGKASGVATLLVTFSFLSFEVVSRSVSSLLPCMSYSGMRTFVPIMMMITKLFVKTEHKSLLFFSVTDYDIRFNYGHE
jgi:hypothetical protein